MQPPEPGRPAPQTYIDAPDPGEGRNWPAQSPEPGRPDQREYLKSPHADAGQGRAPLAPRGRPAPAGGGLAGSTGRDRAAGQYRAAPPAAGDQTAPAAAVAGAAGGAALAGQPRPAAYVQPELFAAPPALDRPLPHPPRATRRTELAPPPRAGAFSVPGRPRRVLNPEQQAVFKLLKLGLTNRQIAARLGRGPRWVCYRVAEIKRALGAASRLGVARH